MTHCEIVMSEFRTHYPVVVEALLLGNFVLGEYCESPCAVRGTTKLGRQARMQRSSTYCISEHCFKSRNGKRVACRCARSILAQKGGAAYKPRSIEVPHTLVGASLPIKPRFDSDVSASVQVLHFILRSWHRICIRPLITSTSGSQSRCG
jgi:hypothetical protein